jgi:hypothetical protein
MRSFLLLLIIFPVALLAQNTRDFISIKAGISSTNIIFKEAIAPSVDFFGFTFDPGRTFVGEGPQFGINKDINDRMYLELSYSAFSGKEYKIKANGPEAYYENYYTLKGFEVPLTVNYLIRRPERRLRVNLGAGVQYIEAHLKQYETFGMLGGVSSQLYKFNISEFQLTVSSGIQFRIIPDLYAAFIIKAAFSFNGRYSDSPSLTLKYSFRKKKQE